MTPKSLISIGLLATLALVTSLFADNWKPPQPRILASPDGSHGFKVLKPEFGGVSEGVLFRLDADGQEQIVWQAKLVNTPHQVVVDEAGKYVATIDTYGIRGYAHSLVIYGEKGTVIRDCKLEELLSEEEIQTKVPHSEAARRWTDKASFQIEDGQLVARLSWGKTIRVELASGKVVGQDAPADERLAGLIGTAFKDDEPTRIAYHYPHGQVFPPALIRDQFHDGELMRPSVRIELVGYVEVPEEMTVDIYHAAGGVNEDHGTLYLDERRIGQVGDDLAKFVVYTLTLPKGSHQIRWVLTGGTFQANLLKIQSSKTGELLKVFHTAAQRDQTGASKAVKTIEAAGELEGWPPDFKTWTRASTEGT